METAQKIRVTSRIAYRKAKLSDRDNICALLDSMNMFVPSNEALESLISNEDVYVAVEHASGKLVGTNRVSFCTDATTGQIVPAEMQLEPPLPFAHLLPVTGHAVVFYCGSFCVVPEHQRTFVACRLCEISGYDQISRVVRQYAGSEGHSFDSVLVVFDTGHDNTVSQRLAAHFFKKSIERVCNRNCEVNYTSFNYERAGRFTSKAHLHSFHLTEDTKQSMPSEISD